MKRTIELVPVRDLSPELYSYLYQLNFRNRSHMQKRFSQARKGKINGHVTICYEGDNVLGWNLIWYKEGHPIGTPVVYFYVKEKYRRQGVGRSLMKAAYRFCLEFYKKGISVWAHDEVSTKFFNNTTGKITRYSSE